MKGCAVREIVLDTETTGFEPTEGHRIVEIGAVELLNHMPTGRTYHQYINPQRPMPKEAFDVHGLGDEFLRDKPLFAAVAQAFLAFIADAPLVIHNAPFDMKFLNAELVAAGQPALPMQRAIDTVVMARKKFPGSPASLDALCRRFGVDNAARQKHGALLDSELLAEVYLELIGGRQPDFGLSGTQTDRHDDASNPTARWRAPPRPLPLPPSLTADETLDHTAFVAKMGDAAIWKRRV
jgi:DNA polymerase III subunit epsilon